MSQFHARGPRPPGLMNIVSRKMGRLLLVAGLLFSAWCTGLSWFASHIPQAVEDTATVTDAIVVLTGGSNRLREGFALLAAKRASKLFVSGVYRGLDVAELLRVFKQKPAELECCVVLGYSADDTIGNADETALWMARQGYKSLRLVTASYHMQRSLLEFHRAMPDIAVIPHPVFPENVKQEQWWMWPGTANLIVFEYNKYLGALLRALILEPGPGNSQP